MYIEIYIVGDNNSTTCPQYIGCYVDDPNRDLKHGPGESLTDFLTGESFRNFTSSTCNEKCKGYSYFSLQYGGQCFCGNAYATSYNYQKRPDSECGGVNGLGGIFRNSVYKTCGNENCYPWQII